MAGDLTVANLNANTINAGGAGTLTIEDVVIMDDNTALLTDANSVLPASVVNNTRYVLVNPFGINVPVEVEAEIYSSTGIWSRTGHFYDASAAWGTSASYVEGVGIVVQTATTSVMNGTASYGGGGHGTATTITTAPCRVRVTRIGGN